jgi:hypothetical protein
VSTRTVTLQSSVQSSEAARSRHIEPDEDADSRHVDIIAMLILGVFFIVGFFLWERHVVYKTTRPPPCDCNSGHVRTVDWPRSTSSASSVGWGSS